MKNNVNENVLVKYLLDELTTDERREVALWLADSDAHRKIFRDLTEIWEQTGRIAVPPAIDENAAWQRFTARVQGSTATKKSYWVRNIIKVAAALVLLLGGTWTALHFAGSNIDNKVAVNPQRYKQVAPTPLPMSDYTAARQNHDTAKVPAKSIAARVPIKHSKKAGEKHKQTLAISTTDELEKLICNSTQCPIQICITQTVNCNGSKPTTVATCTTLEADQSGQLCFKTFTHSCNMMVDEISIEKLSTGETIVLNAHSTPATAQDVFNYITGYKQGSITAGLFHSDCNNDGTSRGLTLENSYGSLQLQ